MRGGLNWPETRKERVVAILLSEWSINIGRDESLFVSAELYIVSIGEVRWMACKHGWIEHCIIVQWNQECIVYAISLIA